MKSFKKSNDFFFAYWCKLNFTKILVAIALIELGMKYEDAVDLIRKKRRGAINARQLEFLAKYKRRKYFLKGKNKCQIQ